MYNAEKPQSTSGPQRKKRKSNGKAANKSKLGDEAYTVDYEDIPEAAPFIVQQQTGVDGAPPAGQHQNGSGGGAQNGYGGGAPPAGQQQNGSGGGAPPAGQHQNGSGGGAQNGYGGGAPPAGQEQNGLGGGAQNGYGGGAPPAGQHQNGFGGGAQNGYGGGAPPAGQHQNGLGSLEVAVHLDAECGQSSARVAFPRHLFVCTNFHMWK